MMNCGNLTKWSDWYLEPGQSQRRFGEQNIGNNEYVDIIQRLIWEELDSEKNLDFRINSQFSKTRS